MFKAFPLDMSQFDWLFGSTRIAAAEQDELRKFPGSRHVAVISKGDIFIFDVIDEKGCHLSPRQILANLEFIQHQPARTQRMPNRSSGIGIITAMPRDTALMARDRLESLGNKRNLDLIDSALFVLVLSQETTDHFPGVLSDMVAGPADSRWFEKSFSLIMAHDKVHCCPAATYESCSTAAFKHGRTETIRSATLETRRFLELIRRHKGSVRLPVSDCDLREALIKCSVKHNQLSKEAAMGQGWDRHLFVLKHFAEEAAGGTKSLPSIFEDPNYRKINQIILSTSTLSSPALQGATFAPTDSNGYGVGYLIDDKGCSISTSSWRSSKYSNGLQFVDAFHESIKELSSLIDSNN
nr:unnamed protein product [Spirometra erinaceieuropaei]